MVTRRAPESAPEGAPFGAHNSVERHADLNLSLPIQKLTDILLSAAILSS